MNPRKNHDTSRFSVPVVAFGIGLLYLVASLIAGEARTGLIMLGIMVAYGVFLLIGGRSDVVQMLRGQPADERYQQILNQATVIAANVVAVFTVTMFVVSLATDGDARPYATIAAVFGVTFIAALAWLRYRT